MRVKVGATREGRITAAYAYLAFEAGAFPGSLVIGGAWSVFSAYDIPNLVIDGYDVVVNKPKTGAYRAPGATHAAFAMGGRRRRARRDVGNRSHRAAPHERGQRGHAAAVRTGQSTDSCVEVLEAMRDHPHYSTPIEGENRGRGVAVGFWMNGTAAAACTLQVNPDGSMTLSEGSADIGGSRAAVAMHAAEVLGVPVESINPSGRGHRLHRLHGGHGGQQHGLQDRLGCLRGCPGRQAPDDRAGGKDMGGRSRLRLTSNRGRLCLQEPTLSSA